MESIVITEKEKGILSLSWRKYPYATHYLLLGLTPLHYYEIIKRTKSNHVTIKKTTIQKYQEIKIKYIIGEEYKDKIISPSYQIAKENLEEIKVEFLQSNQNYTLSFQNKSFYDKYYIYEKQNNSFHLIIETEDFQINSSLLKENHTYFIEGLINNQITGQSKELIILKKDKPKKKRIPISVIIPVYNAKYFLSRCIDSILLSTLEPEEIILINDGSTDNSQEIINWYKKKYPDLIRTYTQENQGVSYARNKGIELATKDYIAFLDHDDMPHPYMYEELYKTALTKNADIVIGKVIIRNKYNEKQICLGLHDNVHYSYQRMIEEKNKKTKDNIYFVAIWNKIIKSSLLKEHPFMNQNYYEDTSMTRTIYSYINQFYYVKDAIYIWDCRFQKTIGTTTNQYYLKENQEELFYHKHYINAVLSAIEKGNQKRKEILIYDCIKELMDYLKKIQTESNIQKVKELYIEEIKKVNNKYILQNNKYLQKNKELSTMISRYI